MSAAKAPPRRNTSGNSPKVRKTSAQPETRSVDERRIEGLMGFAGTIQAACLVTGQLADAQTIEMHAPRLIPEVVSLAGKYEIVAKPVDFLCQVGPLAGLIAVGLPFGLQIAANHGWIKSEALPPNSGVLPPTVLEAQARAQIARLQAEAMKMQAEAMREAQEAEQAMQRILNEQTQLMPTVEVEDQGVNGRSHTVFVEP